MGPLELFSEVLSARERIQSAIAETPCRPSAWLSGETGKRVLLKLENEQRTGSFKARGAWSRLTALSQAQRRAGVVAASAGNHGLAVADAARSLSVPALVLLPSGASADREQRITALGARVERFGADCVETERRARLLAEEEGLVYVSPYNDPLVVAGQGTLGLEVLEQCPDVEVVYVALGGGGLLAGVAASLKASRPGVEVVACSPAGSPAMDECVRRGRIVEIPCGFTISESTAGGVEPGAITFPLVRDLADRFLRLEEPAIARAVLAARDREGMLVEGAAGVALAGCLADAARDRRAAVVVVCGGNVTPADLDRMASIVGNPEASGENRRG